MLYPFKEHVKCIPYDPVIFVSGVHPKEIIPESYKDFDREMFNAVLFT